MIPLGSLQQDLIKQMRRRMTDRGTDYYELRLGEFQRNRKVINSLVRRKVICVDEIYDGFRWQRRLCFNTNMPQAEADAITIMWLII